MIKLVCFDLGGVMVRLCRGWRHACEKAGVDVPTKIDDADALLHMRDAVVQNEIGVMGQDVFLDEVGWLFDMSRHDLQAASDAYLDGMYDGICDLINAVKAAGVKTACLSNTNENHWRIMTGGNGVNALPLGELDYRFASQLIGDRKPNESIYRHVEEVTGLAGESIMFFDDSAVNIAAAAKCGWAARHVTDQTEPARMMRAYLEEAGVLGT
ncbi:HAD family hydrolase [Poriferisphaera sp. WC338]|uniref:HAD family hydrolase n=1 Tax=Poriferisphaera sp. WC338 TaxID=3425129 RepID=UPI003D818020